MTEAERSQEIWRRSNALAWTLNWRGHARAIELAHAATAAGDLEEARLWEAVEARLRPRRV